MTQPSAASTSATRSASATHPKPTPHISRFAAFRPRSLRFSEEHIHAYPNRPLAFLLAITRENAGLIALTTLIACLTSVASVAQIHFVGKMLDSGLEHGITAELLAPAGSFVVATLILALTLCTEIPENMLWMRAMIHPQRTLAARLFPRRTNLEMQTGDVVSVLNSDTYMVGAMIINTPSTLASLLSFALVAVLMMRMSVPLGLAVIIGLPLVMAVVSWISRIMAKWREPLREEQGKLTTLATDGVVGLRVMRGVGGEDYYNARYREQSEAVKKAGFDAAPSRALMSTVTNGGPLIFQAVIVTVGVSMLLSGHLTAGELFAFAGYCAILSMPIIMFSSFATTAVAAWVSAKKITRALAAEPLLPDTGTVIPPAWHTVSLYDAAADLHIEAGRFTAVVGANVEEGTAIAARLARMNDDADIRLRWPAPPPNGGPGGAPTPGAAPTEGTAPGARETPASGKSHGPREARAADIPLDELRAHIRYSGPVADLFAGTLRENLQGEHAPEVPARTLPQLFEDYSSGQAGQQHAPADTSADDRLNRALAAAQARDAVDSLGGLDGTVTERGRNVSGGQRQRLVLARLLASDPDIAILVDPTSAVDSHTEARIAAALSQARKGRTTVVVSASPLVLGAADVVVLIRDGKEIARGTHAHLLDHPDYRRIVVRETGEEPQPGETGSAARPAAANRAAAKTPQPGEELA
ncbi:ABC transporter transmembrane domain-containing protein [Schaalia turicensis]|uniref:ABC transporter transmembrane domain-containing protein n=1 Tax=Schaalia turicensis TaxID=131111 RepID=UPI0036AC019F